MGVARVLAGRRDSLRGDVVFFFQPAEEDHPGGAAPMIAAGALDGVDAIFGLHLWQPLPSGVVGIRPGPLMAQSDSFALTIHGKGGHASQPHLTVDPVLVAAHVVTAAQSIASRFVDPLAPVVVTFTTIHGGRVHNIIPDSVALGGTVRTLDPDVQQAVSRRLREVCEATCQAFGVRAEFEYEEGYPPVVNDPNAVALVHRVAARELGEGAVRTIDPVMGGEDFARYLQRVPGAFMLLGIGDGRPYPHHNARFDIDERVLPIGVRLLAGLALAALEQPGL
jgi:amidohydrolase